MQIAIHFGAHCTDGDRLIRSLLKNRDILSKEGIVVPGTGRYRQLLRKTMQASDGSLASPDAEQALLDAILDVDHAERIVLSYDNFICVPQRVLAQGMIYPMMAQRAKIYAAMFPGQDCEFFLAVRNPATFLPSLMAKVETTDYQAFLNGCDPLMLHWSETVIAMREGAPEVPVTVWCDEDTPVIWPEVLREVSGHDPFTVLDGTLDILADIMMPEGMSRLTTYLSENPPPTEVQRRRVVSAFLSKFARPEAVEVEVDLPGWTEDYLSELTENFDNDVETIARLPGVTFIGP
jgi:hypothetical protein